MRTESTILPQSSGLSPQSSRNADFQFQVVDRGLLWSRVRLQLAQVAELTGLDRRRLCYWVSKGYLVPVACNPDRFDGAAVEKVLLLRQALAAGIPLRRALRLYEQRASQLALQESPPAGVESRTVAFLRAELASARRALESALQALEPCAPRDGQIERDEALAAVGS